MSDIGILWQQPKAFWAAAVVGLMGAAAITGAYWTLKAVDNPPTAVLTSRILNPVIEQGGVLKLYVEITSRANRDCDGKVTREFWREIEFDGRMIPEIWRVVAPAPIVVDGTSAYVINVPLTIIGDMDIPTGDWQFQGETSYYCNTWFGGAKRYRTTFKPIKIVPKGSL